MREDGISAPPGVTFRYELLMQRENASPIGARRVRDDGLDWVRKEEMMSSFCDNSGGSQSPPQCDFGASSPSPR